MDADDLSQLRDRLTAVDRQILELVAERTSLSLEIGRIKREMGRGTRDFAREKVVLERARDHAASLGLPPKLAERMTLALIAESLSVQEQDRISRAASGADQRALVIGGSGKMGRWFVGFLAAQGFEVSVADPTPGPTDVPRVDAWQDTALDHDLIVVATPLHATNEVLHALAARTPAGVVFDVGSLKTPLRTGLHALRDAGVAVTSIHPMFGPDTSLLSGRHVLFVDVGVPAATERIRALFGETLAEQADMDLDTHDRLMAFVLGLSHATSLAFNAALARSGAELPMLSRISSTTFDAQLDVSSRVAAENPQLYYEIQALNRFGATALEALSDAVATLRQTVLSRDEAKFVEIMLQGRAYVHARRDDADSPPGSTPAT